MPASGVNHGQPAGERFISNVEHKGNEWKLPHWHATAFLPKYDGFLGNPGGKSITLVIDAAVEKLTSALAWQ